MAGQDVELLSCPLALSVHAVLGQVKTIARTVAAPQALLSMTVTVPGMTIAVQLSYLSKSIGWRKSIFHPFFSSIFVELPGLSDFQVGLFWVLAELRQ